MADLNVENERKKVEELRLKAESPDTLPTLDDYAMIDGKYRVVRPYYFDFIFSVKQRQHNQTIVDVFSKEFPARTREYYEHAARIGSLRVEANPNAPLTTPLPAGTRLRHLVHRHEPPVISVPVTVLKETDEYVAVNKPPSMPVHVAGQYRKNTVMSILIAQRPEFSTLLPVHRLDKPVSGVLIFAKSAAAADKLRIGIADKGSVEKIYVAKVLGIFPGNGELVTADVALAFNTIENHAYPVGYSTLESGGGEGGGGAGDIEEDNKEREQDQIEEIEGEESKRSRKKRRKNKLTKAERVALMQAAAVAAATKPPPSRPAVTQFRLLHTSPDGLTSLVECRPLTGRSHQIRAHLSYLGHPIANDIQYGGTYEGPRNCRAVADAMGVAWGVVEQKATGNGGGSEGLVAQQCRGSKDEEEAQELLIREEREKNNEFFMQQGLCPDIVAPDELNDPHCPHCPRYGPKNYPADLRPLWLHARKYASPDWEFEAPLPEWASEVL